MLLWFHQQVLKPLLIRIVLSITLVMFLVLICSGLKTDASVPEEMIRIAIVKNATEIVVDGEGVLASSESGSPVSLVMPVRITRIRDAVVVAGVSYRKLFFSSAQAVFVNGKPYRGAAEILPVDKGLLVINQLPLETYLVGLINCEISSAWPIESVKAQAVIARTYALNRKELRKKALFHLESTVMDQVYDGCLIEDSRARRAVMDTAGEVLKYRGTIIQAFYHSNCGGRTEASEQVWGRALPYLKGVECQYCLTNPTTSWEQKLSLKDIEAKLRSAGFRVAGLTGLKPGQLNNSGRLKYILAVSSRGEARVAGDQFRKAIGYGVIKSTNFRMKASNGDITFSGLGNGHGVGLCQWGAKQRALDGFSYAEILSYYYPGTEIQRISDIR